MYVCVCVRWGGCVRRERDRARGLGACEKERKKTEPVPCGFVSGRVSGDKGYVKVAAN